MCLSSLQRRQVLPGPRTGRRKEECRNSAGKEVIASDKQTLIIYRAAINNYRKDYYHLLASTRIFLLAHSNYLPSLACVFLSKTWREE